jgi:hypothetical protein
MKKKRKDATVKARAATVPDNLVHGIRPTKKRKRRHGPEAERLKIDVPWVEAIDTALAKKRPPGGWPKK